MKKSLVGVVGVAAALMMVFGASANANPYDAYAGRTYAQVQEATNGQAKIGTRVGQYLPTEECIVTGSRRLSAGGNTFLVDLNCNDPKSAGGDGNDHAGNSAMSPAGRKMLALKEQAVSVSENYETFVAAGKSPWCERNYDSCVRICEQSGACSDELLQFLGV